MLQNFSTKDLIQSPFVEVGDYTYGRPAIHYATRIAGILEVPAAWRFIAYPCLGYPQQASDSPELERLGWERRRPTQDFIYRR